jgi:hypothetical protein
MLRIKNLLLSIAIVTTGSALGACDGDFDGDDGDEAGEDDDGDGEDGDENDGDDG